MVTVPPCFAPADELVVELLDFELEPQAAIATIEASHPREPHHYLAFIGVDPEWQGRGLRAALSSGQVRAAEPDASSPLGWCEVEGHKAGSTSPLRLRNSPSSP